MNSHQIFKKLWFRCCLYLSLGGLIYLKLLVYQDAINPDAQFIIPLLEQIEGPIHYLQALLSFNTFDIQPIRDLSFWLDITIYRTTGYNSFVLHNLLIWGLVTSQITKLVERYRPEFDAITITLIGAAFFSYPLFSQVVPWGMARKHLLSVLFILFATRGVLEHHKTPWKVILYYILSVLSHPITLLWPVWAFAHKFLEKQRSLKNLLPLVIAFFFMLYFFVLTYQYYSTSVLFKAIFGERTVEVFNIPDKVLILGHHFFQIFFPYLLGYRYYLGHWTSLAGLSFLGVFLLLLLVAKVPKKEIFKWSLFLLLPLAMATAKAVIFYDTYLILPLIATLMLIAQLLPVNSSPKLKIVISSLIPVWAFLCFFNAEGWRDDVLLMKRTFENRLSCNSAYEYIGKAYENGKPPADDEAKEFILSHDCKPVSFDAESIIVVKTFMLYYDKKMPQEMKIGFLKKYAELAIYPGMVLAAEYINNNQLTEADQQIEQLIKTYGKIHYREEYLPVIAEVLKPYCNQKSNQRCLNFLRPFVTKKDPFYYR